MKINVVYLGLGRVLLSNGISLNALLEAYVLCSPQILCIISL